MIITIAGEPGAGKSTVARALAEKLGYHFYSTGDLRGEIAQRHGITIDELNEIGKKEIWPHKECDDMTLEIGKSQDDLVIDSWLAWHFIPDSKKFYLKVDPEVAAQRVLQNQRPDEQHQGTVEGVNTMLQERHEVVVETWRQMYGVDILDEANYDYVIDTTPLTPQQVVQKILEKVKN